MRPFALLVLLALAGCDGIGDAVGGDDRAALEAARARWTAAEINDYRYTYRRMPCECPPGALGPFEITVRDGEPVAARNGRERLNLDTFGVWTVETLFHAIEETLDDGRNVDVTYEAARGFPVTVLLDPESMPMDGGYGAEVTIFEALD